MMTDSEKTDPNTVPRDEPERRHDPRRYQVSANRGRARHRLRYVESGGAAVADSADACSLCSDLPVR